MVQLEGRCRIHEINILFPLTAQKGPREEAWGGGGKKKKKIFFPQKEKKRRGGGGGGGGGGDTEGGQKERVTEREFVCLSVCLCNDDVIPPILIINSFEVPC